MDIKAIAENYDLDQNDFEQYLQLANLSYEEENGIPVILDENVEPYVKMYRANLEKRWREHKEKQQREQEALAKKSKAIAEMPVSTLATLEGYKILSRHGVISCDHAVKISRAELVDSQDQTPLTEALAKCRRHALVKLLETVYDMGCNAVIGLSYNYLTLQHGTVYDPYVICVTATANAVTVTGPQR